MRALRLLHRHLPTYVIGGDERDSPRGRIYLIKDLLETGRAPQAEDVAPIDHCLSCYSCMTTCPSGVDYRRLVDSSRALIETRYRRGLADRLLRQTLALALTSPARFRFALWLAKIGAAFQAAHRRTARRRSADGGDARPGACSRGRRPRQAEVSDLGYSGRR